MLYKNEKLSKYFWRSEFACRGENCCDHSTPWPHPYLLFALDELREAVGKPIKINSGYRCNWHNAEITDAASDSNHCRGIAADISAQGMSGRELAMLANSVAAFRHGGIGIYDKYIHVDIGKNRRWVG